MSGPGWFARSLRTRSGLLQWVMLLAAAGFVAWILASRGEDLRSAFKLTPLLFALISISSFVTFALNGLELQVLARKFDSHIPLKEALALGLMVSTLNYLPMKTGTVLNGVIMRARYRLPLTDFGALIAGSSVIHLWVAAVLAGTSLLVGSTVNLTWGLSMLLGPTVLVAVLVLWGRTRTAGRFQAHDSKFVRLGWRLVDGVGLIFGDWRLLAIEMGINGGLIIMWATRSYWSFQALGTDASWTSVLTVTALGIALTRLSFIPGGVGFREAGAAFGSAITGLSADVGMAASVIDRAVMLVWLLVIGVPTTLWMLRLAGVSMDAAFGPVGKEPSDGAL